MTSPMRRPDEPVDPDVDLRHPGPYDASAPPRPATVLAVVALGGAAGAAARHGAALLWPTAPGAFPWTTLLVNASGCAVLGVLMTLLSEVWTAHPFVRPFFGTGVLGGFTTFSSYAAEIRQLAEGGDPGTALGYLTLTLVAALVPVWVSVTLTRHAVTLRRPATGPGTSSRSGRGPADATARDTAPGPQ